MPVEDMAALGEFLNSTTAESLDRLEKTRSSVMADAVPTRSSITGRAATTMSTTVVFSSRHG